MTKKQMLVLATGCSNVGKAFEAMGLALLEETYNAPVAEEAPATIPLAETPSLTPSLEPSAPSNSLDSSLTPSPAIVEIPTTLPLSTTLSSPSEVSETPVEPTIASPAPSLSTSQAPDVEAALKALRTVDLAAAARSELKSLADQFGLETSGKRASELRGMLEKLLEEHGAEAIPVPPKTALLDDLDHFVALHREALTASGFFNPAPTGDPENPTYGEILADDALLVAAWKDNIWPLYQDGSWPALKAQAKTTVS